LTTDPDTSDDAVHANGQGRPLDGLRVLDFTTILAGPHLTQWLAVLGAEVIKIETHLRAESRLVSVLAKTPRKMGVNESDSFAIHNYAKKSVTVNMKKPEGLALVRRLVGLSDIVTENFGGSVMQRWGLGYDDLCTLRPDVICYAGSGYGRTGPRSNDPLYAPVADAQCGVTILNGQPDGVPVTLGSSGWTDIAMAMHGAVAVLAAVAHREQTGQGQYIDTAMVECEAQFLGDIHLDYLMNGRTGQRMGNSHVSGAPHGCYPAAGVDRWVAIAVFNDADWVRFCRAAGEPAWTRQPEFSDQLGRWRNRDVLDPLVASWTVTEEARTIATRLQAEGVAATASLDLAEVMADPQLAARDFFKEQAHKAMGRLVFAGLPVKFSRSLEGNFDPSPLLGEHNDYVFGDLLGLSKSDIRSLEAEQVLY
jgi:crotonobetainyl-CoA:carnitine CoA-transferase CaiB-like acyl-CoA transferase